jgi:hypothetical protein
MIQHRNTQRADRDDHTSSDTSATPDSETRASQTDADACKMKFAAGGYHLAYNVQTVTDVSSGLIVTIDVVEQGCDNGLLATLVNHAQTVTGVPVETVVADAGYSSRAEVQALEEQGLTVVMPSKNEAKDRRTSLRLIHQLQNLLFRRRDKRIEFDDLFRVAALFVFAEAK